MIVKRGKAEILGVIPEEEVTDSDELKAKRAQEELSKKEANKNSMER